MEEMPEIIRTDIISDSNDLFWNPSPSWTQGLAPRPVLVISRPFGKETPEAVQIGKILAACKLGSDTYHILHFPETAVCAWHQLRDTLHPSTVMLFGIPPEQLGISVHFMPHQLNRFDRASWITTSELTELMSQPDIKNHLWNYGLKPVFIDGAYT